MSKSIIYKERIHSNRMIFVYLRSDAVEELYINETSRIATHEQYDNTRQSTAFILQQFLVKHNCGYSCSLLIVPCCF